MIKLLFKFFDCDETIIYSTEPHQFNSWDEVVEFGQSRCDEIMNIYDLMSLCWDYEEITNTPPKD